MPHFFVECMNRPRMHFFAQLVRACVITLTGAALLWQQAAVAGPWTVWTAGDYYMSASGESSLGQGEHVVLSLNVLRYSRGSDWDKENQCFVSSVNGVARMIFCLEKKRASLSGAIWLSNQKNTALVCVRQCGKSVPPVLIAGSDG